VLHGLSLSMGSRNAVDVNLAAFEVLGRIGVAALWMKWLGDQGSDPEERIAREGIAHYTRAGLVLIRNNPALLLPVPDRQSTDGALFLLAWLESGLDGQEVSSWLDEMANRLDFTVRARGRYPLTSADYRDLTDHPVDRSDEYFEESTAGSTLIPLLSA